MLNDNAHPTVGKDGRYQVVRTAADRRLPGHIRTLVLRRDRYQCVFCGHNGILEVDHIIPWSAGGADDMDNLRTLCRPCNQDRSNYRVPGDDHRRLPTARECVYCNADLIGGQELAAVYCIICNTKAPGVPRDSLSRRQEPQEPQAHEFLDLRDDKAGELAALAAKYRADAVATIRLALCDQSSAGAL